MKDNLHAARTLLFTAVLGVFYLAGCAPMVSSPEELERFRRAGPLLTAGDLESKMMGTTGPYRVVIGDVLRFEMPVELRIESSELAEWLRPGWGRYASDSYLVRISDAGTIVLPVIGEVKVAGKTLAGIEDRIKGMYHPKYVANPPMLYCEVERYYNEHERVFTVLGLVNKPDAYAYPPDVQYNLMNALAYAGGLHMVADPKYVNIFRQDLDGTVVEAIISIRDRDLIDAYAIAIKPGDVVYVAQTARTRLNQFLSNTFRFTVGSRVYVD